MKCFYPQCGRKAPKDTLYRINAKGSSGVWACKEHLKNTDAKVGPAVGEIIILLEKR